MSYATGTTHYNLPQTVGTDKRDWTDTNEAFASVDTALYGAVQDAETATSGIQTLNTAVDTINGKLATDEGNISTLSGKVSTLEGTVAGHTSAIADVRSDLQDNIEAHKEATATSTHAYSIGDTFYYNDILYKATANIGVGDTIVPNTNCTGITVMSEIQSQTVPTAAQVSYDNTSSGLTADDVQEAIDELATGLGSVEIAFTSTDTFGAKLDALSALIDRNKISYKSKLFMVFPGTNTKIYDLIRMDDNGTLMFRYAVGGSANIAIETMSVKNSSSIYASGSVNSGGFTGTDSTASTIGASGKFEVYY